MPRIGLWELLFLLLIIVVLFGSTKIPQLGRGLGEGIRNFKRGLKGGDEPDTERAAPPAQDRS